MSLHGLWTIFGADTPAGKQLRSIICDNRESVSKIKYPRLKLRTGSPPKTKVPEARLPVKYPKFAKRTEIKVAPYQSKRPLPAISQRLKSEPSEERIPHGNTRDLSKEKTRLQDIFQFSKPGTIVNETETMELCEKYLTIVDSWNHL